MPAAPRGVTRSRGAPVCLTSTSTFTLTQLHTVLASPWLQAARVCARAHTRSVAKPKNVPFWGL